MPRTVPHGRNASNPLIVIDRSEVRPGKLDALKAALRALVEFVEANEPRPIAYQAYLTPGGHQVTVVQVHPDSASMELHMKLAGPAFPQFVELVKLAEMHVYGTPSDALLEQLRGKVKMLGSGALRVHEPHAGFARFGTR
jgi:quinol monooxygenase YgiN